MTRAIRSIPIALAVISAIFAAYAVYFLLIVNYRKMTPAYMPWAVVFGILCPFLAVGFGLAARRRWRRSLAEPRSS